LNFTPLSSQAAGLLPGYRGTLAEVRRLAAATHQETLTISQFPPSLLTVEVVREAATKKLPKAARIRRQVTSG
jgi:hypothetical protein